MSKIKLAVDMTGNVDGKLQMVENAIKRIEKLNGTSIKIKVNDSQVDGLLRKLEQVNNNFSLKINTNSIKELEKSLKNLKLDINDSAFTELQRKLDGLKVKIDVDLAGDVLRQIEGLQGSTINLKVDTSDLDALEDRLSRLLENYLGEGSGGSGGVLGNAAQGGILAGLTGGSILTGAGVGAGVAMTGKAVLSDAEFDELYKRLRMSIGNEDDAKQLYSILKKVNRSGSVSDLNQLGDSGVALGGLLRNHDLNDNELEKLFQIESVFRNNYDVDSKELFNTLNGLMSKEGGDLDKYLNLLNKGFQSGTNNLRGDFLDSIQEFSDQYTAGGFTSDDMVNFYANSVKEGDWNTDGIGNTMLELVNNFSGLANLGNDNDMKDLRNNLDLIGLDWDKLIKKWKKGGPEAQSVLYDISKALLDTDKDTRRIVGTEIFGTPFEDHMDVILQSYIGGNSYLESFSDTVEDTIRQNLDSTFVQVESFKNNLNQLMANFGNELSEVIVPVLGGINSILESTNVWLEGVSEKSNVWRDILFNIIDPTGLIKDSFDFIGEILNGIDEDTNIWQSSLDVIGEKWDNILNKIKKIFELLKNGVVGGFDFLTEGFNGSSDSSLGFTDKLKNNSVMKFLFNLDDAKEQTETKVKNTGSVGNLPSRFNGLGGNNLNINNNSNLILSNGMMKNVIGNVNTRNNYLLR